MGESWLSRLVAASAPRLSRPPTPGPGLPRRSLAESLKSPGVRIVAEVKRRSPSAGVLRDPLLPGELARSYEAGGAAALSVVTEPEFFWGDAAWVAEVKKASSLPVLQKDFFSRPEHLQHGVAAGADAVLLIARVLPGSLLSEMLACCRELGVEALVETHDRHELEAAVAAGATLVGVNSRDLASFTVDVERAASLVRELPAGVVGVLESGIKSRTQFRELCEGGVRCFLVGEYLLRQADPTAALRELVAPW
ncbi:MAG: indole-3-glycerol phosphate synthase TrpC [Thermoanaerobaculum sp.]